MRSRGRGEVNGEGMAVFSKGPGVRGGGLSPIKCLVCVVVVAMVMVVMMVLVVVVVVVVEGGESEGKP